MDPTNTIKPLSSVVDTTLQSKIEDREIRVKMISFFILGLARIEPRASEGEERTLPLCHAPSMQLLLFK